MVIQKFATKEKANEFIDSHIANMEFETMLDNCGNDIIKIADGSYIRILNWINNTYIVIIDFK